MPRVLLSAFGRLSICSNRCGAHRRPRATFAECASDPPAPPQTSGGAEITQLLQAWEHGDIEARDELFTRVYPELRRIARRHLGRRQTTLQATELLHETYLRVSGQQQLSWQSRLQFFAFASQVARQVLVDRYRRKDSLKRGKGFHQLTLDAERLTAPEAPVDVLALDDALTRLADFDAEAARVVELRYFGGLTLPEIAATLSIGEATAQRRWSMARAWLRRQLS